MQTLFPGPKPFLVLAITLWAGSTEVLAQTPLRHFSPPETLFTDPAKISNEQDDFTLMNRMLELINAVPPGEEITVCVFKFETGSLAQALLDAQHRGVKVRVIINKGETSKKINRETKDMFKSELEDFHYIENTITGKAIIHNKFILFSRVEGVQQHYSNVVLQTSSNFQDKGTGKLQDLVILNDQGLYYAYLDFWYEIKVLGKAERLDDYDYLKFTQSELYKAYFFPKRKNDREVGKDNVVKILENILQPKSVSIRLAHGKWTEGRERIVEALKKIISEGAQVQIVTNGNLEDDIMRHLEDLDANLVVLGEEANLHTKFFLVDDGTRKTVYTGSHNFSERSLRDNFEVLLEINDPTVYKNYLSFFEKISALD